MKEADEKLFVIKKKRHNNLNSNIQKIKDDVKNNNIKPKLRKEPLPMKLRALPQSFWQQPNNTPSISPGTIYPVLSPLTKDENPLNSDQKVQSSDSTDRDEVISDANTDLLFSLFRTINNENQAKTKSKRRTIVARRGRPRRTTSKKVTIRDEDPYLASGVAESIKPLLPARSNTNESIHSRIAQGEQIFSMLPLGNWEQNLVMNSTNNDHNYSQILSELVVQL